LEDNKASAFAYETASYESWLKMIKGSGWAISAVIKGGKIMSGVEGL
jgi:putative sterol carrier protein